MGGNSLLISHLCVRKKIYCWQPADLSKSAGNCPRKTKNPSLRLLQRLKSSTQTHELFSNFCGTGIYRIKHVLKKSFSVPSQEVCFWSRRKIYQAKKNEYRRKTIPSPPPLVLNVNYLSGDAWYCIGWYETPRQQCLIQSAAAGVNCAINLDVYTFQPYSLKSITSFRTSALITWFHCFSQQSAVFLYARVKHSLPHERCILAYWKVFDFWWNKNKLG